MTQFSFIFPSFDDHYHSPFHNIYLQTEIYIILRTKLTREALSLAILEIHLQRRKKKLKVFMVDQACHL